MKILHICAVSCTADTLLKPQINYFLSQKIEVEIACSPGEEVEILQKQGYIVHPVQIDRKISLFSNLKSIYQLIKLIRNQRYDIVHVHTPIASVLGRVAAKIAGVKQIIYTAHGFPFHDLSSPKEYFFYSNVEKYIALLTDLILTQNYEDITTAKKLGLCPPEKIDYLGNGIDIERFHKQHLNSEHQTQLRKSLGIPNSANLIIGTIGRLTYKKGSGYLIEAAAKLLTDFPNLHILIIGPEFVTDPEPFQAEIREKIHNLGLNKNVTLTGTRKDIPEILGLLDIFTLPTFTHEGLPRSILEAMSMSLPIVTTDIRGCREAVVHGKNGLIVPPKNSDELANALKQLLSNPQLRLDYGKNSREIVEAQYNENFVFKRLTKHYKILGDYCC